MTHPLRILLLGLAIASVGHAQSAPDHSDHDARTPRAPHATSSGALGDYVMTRDGGGTSWVPDSTPTEMIHMRAGDWTFMIHGFANFAYHGESEPRGTRAIYSTNMAMLSMRRPLGDGKLDFRVMASLEPLMGRTGYPLLLQTGETADGVNPLFDRQHPHDLLMGIGMTFSLPVGRDGSLFAYLAPVGDPALGPPAFMHRFSSVDNPLAPIAHHWLDATHISHGVITAGFVTGEKVKIEGSVFNGREPDADRWDVDSMGLNSYSARVTVNPSPNWSVQASLGQLNSAEALHPDFDVQRITASIAYNTPFSNGGNLSATLAWGRNKTDRPRRPPEQLPVGTHTHFSAGISPTQAALLAEAALRLDESQTFFVRWELAEKDELFEIADPRHDLIYPVKKFTFGYLYDFLSASHLRVGAGGYAGYHFLPLDLNNVYGQRPNAYGFYFRLKII